MKKLLAIVLCLVFCLSLVACGGGDPDAVAKFVEENESLFTSQFAQTGASAEVKADGTTVVIDLRHSMYDALTDEQIEAVQSNTESIDAASEMLELALDSFKSACSDIDGLCCNYYDSTGRFIFTVEID